MYVTAGWLLRLRISPIMENAPRAAKSELESPRSRRTPEESTSEN
jgi:hypothetical protein